MLRAAGFKVRFEKIILAAKAPFESPGVFFFVDIIDLGILMPSGKIKILRNHEKVHELKKLLAALHGTSIPAAKLILEQGGFQASLNGVHNTTAGLEGVYCEGTNRWHNCAGYSTLTFSDPENSDDTNLYSAFLELYVDRSNGRSTSGQWVQQPDSIVITGLFIHVVPVQKLYEKGHYGNLRFSSNLFEQLQNHKFIRDRLNPKAVADPGFGLPNPGQQRSSSQPLTDSSSSQTTGSSDRSSSSTTVHREWNCRKCEHHHAGIDADSVRCVACAESKWDMSEFAQFRDVPQRARPRESRGRRW